MNYAMTINNGVITGVHESAYPFTERHFQLNDELKDDEIVLLPNGTAEYETGMHVNCYNDDGSLRDAVWCIERGYMPMPEGKEIINGQLVDKTAPVEEQDPSLLEYLEERARMVANERVGATFFALKPIIADLLKDREADVVIRLKEFLPEWSKRGWERGQSLLRNDYPYKVVQTHDSTEQDDWVPELYQAGFAPWHGKSPDTALPYIKPRHGEENYLPGEYMMWEDGLIYLSQRSTNFSPIEYPNDWYVQKEDGSFGPINAEQPEEPDVPVDPPEEPEDPPVELNRNGTVVWSEWVDVYALYTGIAEKYYQSGDRVTHLGVRKISKMDNNTYEPTDANWAAWEKDVT